VVINLDTPGEDNYSVDTTIIQRCDNREEQWGRWAVVVIGSQTV